ncbi:hypothetical protein FACS189429_5810 [Bacteroidia bacterium]|nr:hypothetical protein FACS189429_5810 [Bacteroidia bacterium]
MFNLKKTKKKMKNQIVKKEKFDVFAFEVLDSSGNLLRGGFSTAYTGGGIDVGGWNWGKQCGCQVTNTNCPCTPEKKDNTVSKL